MRRFLKVIIFILVILVVIYLGVNFVFIKKAGPLICAKIQKVTGKNTYIGDLKLKFPFNLEIRKLNIEGLAHIDYVYLSPSILGFLSGTPSFNEIRIDRAEFNFIRGSPLREAKEAPSKTEIILELKRPKANFIFRKILVENMNLNFTDYDISPEGLRFTVKDVVLSVENLISFPVSIVTNFTLKGRIAWPKDNKEGKIALDGWVNFFKRDIKAYLEINDIDGVYLSPYYRRWVDLEKARIEKASLNFKSDIVGLNNDVVANCVLELVEIGFRPKPEGEPEERAYQIARGVLGILKAIDNDKISLNFTVRTRMDRLEFNFENIRLAFEDKLSQGIKSKKIKSQDILSLPADFIKRAIKGTTDVTKTFIEGALEIGKTITDFFTGPFKKENQKE